jgi:membrane-bound lytic murein transglycosylase A
MIRGISSFCLGLSIVTVTFWGQIANAQSLRPISPERLKHIGLDDKLSSDEVDSDKKTVYRWRTNPNCPAAQAKVSTNAGWNQSQKQALLQAIDYSLDYLNTPKAVASYRKYADTQFNLEHTKRSLLRFKELLLTTDSPQALATAVKQEFTFYQSVGQDQQGKVEFTGYFEPTYTASRVRTTQYLYPLYPQPADFKQWSLPHPTRAQLEGKDGLASGQSILRGQELVWFSDRLEAFLVQVQGSAKLQMTDGTTMTVGYNGSTDYPYISVGGELVKDGVFGKDELTLPKLLEYFANHPQKLDEYIPRNNRFVFFKETDGKPPTGSLGVPVTGDRSIATDKSLMPPGALALIVAPIPDLQPTGIIETKIVSRYVLDQDTGSAIKGAGRVDVFLGSGKVAGDRAGRLNGSGNLFYLLLK